MAGSCATTTATSWRRRSCAHFDGQRTAVSCLGYGLGRRLQLPLFGLLTLRVYLDHTVFVYLSQDVCLVDAGADAVARNVVGMGASRLKTGGQVETVHGVLGPGTDASGRHPFRRYASVFTVFVCA